MSESRGSEASIAWRRPAVATLAVVFLIGGVVLQLTTGQTSGYKQFGAGTLFRLSLAFGALWLAWPSLHRPMRWLPPGVAVVILVGIGVIVAQPRLLPALLPAIVALVSLTGFVRMVRGS